MNKRHLLVYLVVTTILVATQDSFACYYCKDDQVAQATAQTHRMIAELERVQTVARMHAIIANLHAQVSVLSQLCLSPHALQIAACLRHYVDQLALAKMRSLAAPHDTPSYHILPEIIWIEHYLHMLQWPDFQECHTDLQKHYGDLP